MISNFDATRDQLKELAAVINSFKSEAVQLRLVELVFQSARPAIQEEADAADSSGSSGAAAAPRRGRTRAATPATSGSTPKAKTSGRLGGKAMLTRLLGEGFFNKGKTINELVTHCDQNLALKYKQSDFSGPLGRFTRDGALKRTKNGDQQYEYVKA